MKEQIEEMVNAITENTGDTMDFADKYVCAHSIYNAGYRKVPEASIILTRAELDALNKYQERFKGQDAEEVIATEVAREIFEEIENRAFGFGACFVEMTRTTFDEIKKKYTEELKNDIT